MHFGCIFFQNLCKPQSVHTCSQLWGKFIVTTIHTITMQHESTYRIQAYFAILWTVYLAVWSFFAKQVALCKEDTDFIISTFYERFIIKSYCSFNKIYKQFLLVIKVLM